MNETVYVYIVHSDINENNIYAEFKTEAEALDYARRNIDELTYVDRVEVALDEAGEIIEMFDSETIWVYTEEADFEDSDENDFFSFQDEEVECQNCGSLVNSDRCIKTDGGDYVCKDCVEEDFDALVETLEENEDVVECKECFELFPKEECTKLAVGYVCPHCHKEIDAETTSSEPEIILVDDVAFSIDFPDAERFEEPDEWEVVNIESEEPNPQPEEPTVEPECVGPECEAPVEAPVTKEETVATLVKDEEEAIEGYDKAAVEIEANSELTPEEKEEALEVIEHIKEEEIEHIEELEELVGTKEEQSENEPISEVEDQAAEEPQPLTETLADLGHSIANFFQKGANAVRNLFHKGIDVISGSKFHLDDYYSPDGKNNKDHIHGNGYKVYGYTEKQEKVQEQKFNKLGDAYEYALELSKALGVKALSVIEVVDYKDEGKPILAIFKDGSLTEKTKNIIIDKANKLSEEETQADRQKAHQEKADTLKAKGTPVEEPKEEEKKPTGEEETKPGEGDELVHATGPADSGKGALLNQRKKNNQKVIAALQDAGFDTSELLVNYTDKSGKNRKKASDKLNKLRKALLGEEVVVEHVNEEHPAIESDQVLVGTDNAVVKCKEYDVVTHSEDEKPLNCDMKDKPLEKPLTEELSEINALEQIRQEAERTGYAFWVYGGSGYIANCIEIVYENGVYIASYYTSTESGKGDTDPEGIIESEDFREVIKVLVDEGWFNPEDDHYQEITAEEAHEYLAGAEKPLEEETHAKYAKPEGNRVQAFNNALKYAKKENKPFIYGYTNHTGKFFAAETPMKVTGSPAEAEKEFRQQYKNCSVVYIAYPDKEFIREGLFTKAEQEEYNMDEEGYSLDSHDQYVRCG